MASQLSKVLSLKCGLHPNIAERVYAAAVLHDVGKVSIPDEILSKPDKLTPQEMEIMKTHTKTGADILSEMPGETGKIAAKIALWHHERYDGKGYWERFTDELPSFISIVSLVDIYCALIHARPYKSAWTMSAKVATVLHNSLPYVTKESILELFPGLTDHQIYAATKAAVRAVADQSASRYPDDDLRGGDPQTVAFAKYLINLAKNNPEDVPKSALHGIILRKQKIFIKGRLSPLI